MAFLKNKKFGDVLKENYITMDDLVKTIEEYNQKYPNDIQIIFELIVTNLI